MKISTNSRYALRFLMRLVQNTTVRRSVSSIAAQEELSEKMLERIASKLCKAGFINSAKGVGGGYALSVAPEEITVTQILDLMETPVFPIHCVETADRCVRGFKDCPCFPLYDDIDKAIRSVTDQYTLARLVENFSPENI